MDKPFYTVFIARKYFFTAEIVHKIELILDSLPKSESRIEYRKTKNKDKRGKKS